jgi:hypothetical protein
MVRKIRGGANYASKYGITKLQTHSFHEKFVHIKQNNLLLSAPIHELEIEALCKTVITPLVLHPCKILSLI